MGKIHVCPETSITSFPADSPDSRLQLLMEIQTFYSLWKIRTKQQMKYLLKDFDKLFCIVKYWVNTVRKQLGTK